MINPLLFYIELFYIVFSAITSEVTVIKLKVILHVTFQGKSNQITVITLLSP